MRCPSCDTRSARRACPALATTICAVCCGTKRQVEIRCPDSCPYLASSRSHPAAVVRKQQEQDMLVLLPGLNGLSEGQQRLFFLSLTLLRRFRGEGFEATRDVDVVDAAGALAATYETESKGLIYEQRAGSPPAQRLAAEVRAVFDKLGRERPSAFVRDAAAVLRQIEQLARDVGKAAPSDPFAFIDLVGRVVGRLGSAGPEPDESDAAEATAEPRIILP